MSTETMQSKAFHDETKIGDCAAQQPLSGVDVVMQSGAVNGRGGFAIVQKAEDTKSKGAA